MKKRVTALFCGIVLTFVGILFRLWSVSGESTAASVEQSTRTQTIAVARGTIYDRYMQPLVNRRYGVVASVAMFEPMLQVLEVQGETEAYRYARAHAADGERAIVSLTDWLPPTAGIAQAWAPERYTEEALACHLIGYVNGYSKGVSGMEKVFDDTLSRYNGEASVTYHTDALGRVAIQSEAQVRNTLPQAKGGIVLTLDAQIQAVAQAAAEQAIDRGAVLISSAQSGELLASVSLPCYDPACVEESLSRADSPLLDRTLINYDLGSVFKLITAAAALENGVSPTRVYTCLGYCCFQGVTVHCHNPLGDGMLTMEQALARSCNCYFMQLANEVGAETIRELATRLGFEEALTLVREHRTARALMPSAEVLSNEAALANFSIGQGALMASPVHVQALMTAIVRDGLWSAPLVYRGEVNERGELVSESTAPVGERVFSASTARALRAMLEAVVADGTGAAAAPSELTAAGKTGTAETGWEIDGKTVEQSWFTGYYPADDPLYVITVLSENGAASGQTAAPLFRTLCEELFQAGLVEKAVSTP